MEYLFVLSADGGWWLKINTVDQLVDYHQKTDAKRYENALRNYFHGKYPKDLIEETAKSGNPEDVVALYSNRDFMYMQAALMKAQDTGGTILDGFSMLRMEAGLSELKELREFGAVYFNVAGGHTFKLKYTQFCRRKELIFPSFSEADIRIKKFSQGGSHWYAYIGDVQLKNGEKEKWNSYEAAKEFAYSVLAKC